MPSPVPGAGSGSLRRPSRRGKRAPAPAERLCPPSRPTSLYTLPPSAHLLHPQARTRLLPVIANHSLANADTLPPSACHRELRPCTRRHLAPLCMLLQITSLQTQTPCPLLHVIANHVLANADTLPPSACYCKSCPCKPDTLPPSACHCEERGGCPATWQSALLAVARNEKWHFRQIRNSLRIRLKRCFFLPFSAGLRIATSLRSSQ